MLRRVLRKRVACLLAAVVLICENRWESRFWGKLSRTASGWVLRARKPWLSRRAAEAVAYACRLTKVRVRLGELAVQAQMISGAQVETAPQPQKSVSRSLGTLLVEQGLPTDTQVTQILSQQLSVPAVSLYPTDF